MWRPWESEFTRNSGVNANVCEGVRDSGSNSAIDQPGPSTNIRIHLNEESQQICFNVYKNLQKKYGFEELNLLKITSELTEVPYSTISKIVRIGPRRRNKSCNYGIPKALDPSLVKKLKTTIYDCYRNNEIPTVEIIMAKLKNGGHEVKFCDRTLHNWLKKMGFKFKTINKRQAICESRRIIELRNIYLEEITKYRQENRHICYLDETWYDTHDTVKKGWTDGTTRCMPQMPTNKGSRLIIVHCGGVDGWIPNVLKLCGKKITHCNVDYHQNMESNVFEEWFEKSLIPNLPASSVIVMDNASYHSRQLTKIPTKASKKEEIQAFLMENDLFYEETYTKNQLLEVLTTKEFRKSYAIEALAEKYGHRILRLPPYFCIFNPIELIWGQLKKRVRRKNCFPKFDKKVVELIKDEASKITKEDWKKCVEKVMKIEEEYRKIGQFHINDGNKFIIDLEESDNEYENCEEGLMEGILEDGKE